MEAFKPECIMEIVLRRLLQQDIFEQIKIRDKNNIDKCDPHLVIYEQVRRRIRVWYHFTLFVAC